MRNDAYQLLYVTVVFARSYPLERLVTKCKPCPSSNYVLLQVHDAMQANSSKEVVIDPIGVGAVGMRKNAIEIVAVVGLDRTRVQIAEADIG